MMSAQIAAGIVVRFTPHVGGCWKILERRVRVESKLLSHGQILTILCDAHENVPPLHHDECEEVHALGFKESVLCQGFGVVTEPAR
jgi:hypothetical protein